MKVVLEKVRDMLTDDGVAYIASPNAGLYTTDLYRFLLSVCKPKEHYILYSEKAFNSIAKKCGLKRVSLQIYNGPREGFPFQTKMEWRMVFKKDI